MFFPFTKPDKSGVVASVPANNAAWAAGVSPRLSDATLTIRSTSTPASNYAVVTISAGYTGEVGNFISLVKQGSRIEVHYTHHKDLNFRVARTAAISGAFDLTKIKTALEALAVGTDGIDFTVTITGTGTSAVDFGKPDGVNKGPMELSGGSDGGETLVLADLAHPNTIAFAISEASTFAAAAVPQYLRSATSGSPYMFSLNPREYLYVRSGSSTAVTNGLSLEEYHFPRGQVKEALNAGFTPQGAPVGFK